MKNGWRRCDIRLTSTGNVAGAVAEPLLIAPSYTPSQRDMRGLILSSYLKNVPKKHRNHENNSSERIIFCTFPVCLPCWSP